MSLFLQFNQRINELLADSCLVCDALSFEPVCRSCLSQIELPSHSCYQCGLPIEGESTCQLCLACLNSPPSFDTVNYIGVYNQFWQQLIYQAKGLRQVNAILAICYLLDQSRLLSEVFDTPIISMPTPRSRLALRGFNLPALLLDRSSFVLNLDWFYVSMPFYQKRQAYLDRKSRLKNKHHFKVKGKVVNKVYIFDDVVTTGSSCHELSTSLKSMGVKEVHVLAVSRAI